MRRRFRQPRLPDPRGAGATFVHGYVGNTVTRGTLVELRDLRRPPTGRC